LTASILRHMQPHMEDAGDGGEDEVQLDGGFMGPQTGGQVPMNVPVGD